MLNQIAVFDGHADLVAQSQEQAQFRRSEIAVVRRAEQQHTEDAIFSLQADADHGAQALSEKHFANVAEGLFFFQRDPVGIAREIAQNDETAKAGDELDEVIVEIAFLDGGAEGIVQASYHDGCGTIFIAIVQDEGACGDADDIENAIQRLRQHFLNFTARKAGGGEIQIGKREHVALDPAALFVVHRHQHEHAADNFGEQCEGLKIGTCHRTQVRLEDEEQAQSAGGEEGTGQQFIGTRFLFAAFLPEDLRSEKEKDSNSESQRDRDPITRIGESPHRGDGGHESDAARGERQPRIQARRTIKCQRCERYHPFADDVNPRRKGRGAGGCRAYEVERNEQPGRRPNKEVRLTLLLINVGKKYAQQKRAGKQHDRARIEMT